MCQCKMWGCVVLVLLSAAFVNSYNLETVHYVKHKGDEDSMFGFSVAPHMVNHDSWLIVGAPEAQTSQPGVSKGGAVYRCQVSQDNSCQQIPFDRSGDHDRLDQKSGQWFGATVNSAGRDQPIVACAPRYVWFTNKRDRRDPVGTCYVSKADFSEFNEYSPCRTNHWGYHRQGSCQAGLGAAISKDGRRLFVGAPGSWYWQGQVYSIDANAKFPYYPGLFGFFGAGQVIQQSLESRPATISTREGTVVDDDSYMGYSVAVGDFTGEGVQGTAVGMPRGASLRGKVVLFTWNLTNYENVTGTQIGSYFGYSIAVTDIEGDGRDDLIIGAPMYTIPNNEGKYEVGRVYILYQKSSEGRFRKAHYLDGFHSKSRFGLSVASLGDINLDGYGDFAVGAPYGGEHENGAVYVYHGSAEGVRQKYAQVIYAEDVSDRRPPVQTFGFSVSGGLDLDHNEYPDLVVGAYLSNEAYFFRAKPVVKVDGYLKFHTPRKQIHLEENNCTLPDGQLGTCTSFELCVKIHGIGVPRVVDLELNYTLDSRRHNQQRLCFSRYENKHNLIESIQLYKDHPQYTCVTKQIYIKNNIRDKLTPLEVSVGYSMREKRQASFQRRDPRSELLPTLDLTSPPVKKDHISIKKNCGSDDKCVPDLNMVVQSSVSKYLLGSGEFLEITVTVRNTGEDSYESTFEMELPYDVHFVKVVQLDRTEVRVSCDEHNNTISCDIGNPLPQNKISQFKIQLLPQKLKEGELFADSYNFYMRVNSSNPEEGTEKNNFAHLSIPIWVDSKLSIGGISLPPDVHYNASLYTEENIKKEAHIGPQVVHLYIIKNNGSSSIKEAEVMFIVTEETLEGDDLFYLLDQPHVYPEGSARCDIVNANDKNYELETRSKSIWETLDIAKSLPSYTLEHKGGGVHVAPGKKITGQLFNETRYNSTYSEEKSGGDSSIHLEERHKGSGGSGGSGSSSLDIETGGGTGNIVNIETIQPPQIVDGETIVITKNVTNVIYKPGITTVKNTTITYGPGGEVISTVVTKDQYPSGGGHVVTGSGGSYHKTSGGSYHETSGGGYRETSGGGYQHGSTHTSGSDGHYGGRHSSSGGGTYVSGGSSHASSGSSHASSGSSHASSGSSHATSGSSHAAGGSSQSIHRSQENTDFSVSGSRHPTQKPVGSLFEWDDNRRSQGQQTTSGRGHIYSSEEFTRHDLDKVAPVTTGQGGSTSHHVSWSTGGQGSQHHQQQGGHHQSGHTYQSGGSGYNIHDDRRYNQNTDERRTHAVEEVNSDEYYDEEYEDEDEVVSSHGQHTSSSQAGVYGQGGSQGHKYNQTESKHGSSYHASGSAQSGRDPSTYGKYDRHQENSASGLEGAAIGQGFKTVSLDLGSLGGDNTLSGGSEHMNVEGHYGGHAQSSGSRGQAESGSQGTSYSRGGTFSSTFGDGGSHHESHSWSSQGGGQSAGRDNVHTDRPVYDNRFHGRRRRQLNTYDGNLEDIFPCNTIKCLRIKCTVGPLLPNKDEIFIALRGRVNLQTLKKVSPSKSVIVSSMMVARISKLHNFKQLKDKEIHTHEILTTIKAEPEAKPEIVPLWVVILSAVAGTLILLLLIFLLYQCGFFKRNRPSSSPERQPLNGY